MADQRAAIYCRISRDAEGERVGVERQEADCRELAKRLNLTIAQVYTDNDVGASRKTRKSKVRHQYRAMLEEVRLGTVSHIVAYSNSRLTRRVRELEDLIDLHEETGVVIHTVVSGQDDLSTADGRMIAGIKAQVDAAEADRIGERTKAALRHKAQSGEPRISSNRPFGWMPDGKTLDPRESELIRQGVRDLMSGVPVNLIRKKWMADGVLTPAGKTEWHWTNTLQVLTSWRTVGVRTYNGEVLREANGEPVRGKWEPIVTVEERERALAQVKARSLTRTRSGKYLLSGLLRCGECSKPMWGSVKTGKGRSTQYVCSSGTGHVSIDAERLELHVLRELAAYVINWALIDAPRAVTEPKTWSGEARLEAVRSKIAELFDAYNQETLGAAYVFPQIQKLEVEANELEASRDKFLAEHAEPTSLLDNVEDLSAFMLEVASWPVSKSLIALKQECEVIVIRKGVRGVRSRDDEVFAARVKIAWRRKLPERLPHEVVEQLRARGSAS